ncbi:glycoside hydrolase family 6 protein [Herbidospora yilanensis]|uniref:glycoside hydrolase family 6 protein n=1 Tax=Herbidospora yilanensis TaxID=354426 RepID=UPI0018DDB621|nr:glycoside hydrolase family 6 protein [Herbidospora yilanensis]
MLVGIVLVFVVLPGVAWAAPGCVVTYGADSWPGGFTGTVAIKNTGDRVDGWTLRFDFTAGQTITYGWSARWSQSGARVQAVNEPYNRVLAPGATVTIGFNGRWTGGNPPPGGFTLNGATCGGPPSPGRVDNPYLGARGYLNPDYVAQVDAAATATGGEVGAAMRKVAFQPTALWLDSVASIGSVRGGLGLRQHLDRALVQALSQGNADPVVVTLVLSDLPGKDCSSMVSTAEFDMTAEGVAAYRSRFVEPVAAILADPRYAPLRIVTLVEPETLGSMVNSTQEPRCVEARTSGAYVQGIRHAVATLGAVPNVYVYLDAARSSVAGWTEVSAPLIDLFAEVVEGTRGVDGFVTNVAGYVPVEEIFLPDATKTIAGAPLYLSRWIDWNPHIDEDDYTRFLRAALIEAGFPEHIGMLIDTSRNGWGGPGRPTAVSVSTDVNTYVDQSRLDRRVNRFNWCNQLNAGIGERPAAAPRPGVDAYIWARPPGESDGASDGPNRWCDPAYAPPIGSWRPSGAAPGAPGYGVFWPSYFRDLVRNAHPPL